MEFSIVIGDIIKMKRNINIDVIKIVAIVLVAMVHYFSYTGYYNVQENLSVFILSFFKWIAFLGVPLFIMTTGYLQCKKTPNKYYYLSLSKILILYVICCGLNFLYNIIMKTPESADSIVVIIYKIINFDYVHYSWYVNMFIGLFLFAPFLNMISMKLSQSDFKLFLIIFGLFIGIPAFINIFGFAYSQTRTSMILPVWWKEIYPIYYYFLGSYICIHKPKISNAKMNFLFFATVIIQSVASLLIVKCGNGTGLIFMNDYASISVIMMSFLLFCMLLHLDFTKLKKKKRGGISIIANSTLAILLSYWYFDNIYYSMLTVSGLRSSLLYLIPSVSLIVFFSFSLGIITNLFSSFLYAKFTNIPIIKKVLK